MTDPYAAAAASAARLAERTDCAAHDAAVILGSGWLPAADALGPPDASVELADLGGFASPTVAGHAPVVRSVTVGGLRVLVFLGRTHLYEGLPVDTVVHGVRTAVAAGCRVVVLTNASGGIRAGLQPGQPVLIRDHLNLTGRSPLAGPPPPAGYPPRFTDLSDLYAARLRAIARAARAGRAAGLAIGRLEQQFELDPVPLVGVVGDPRGHPGPQLGADHAGPIPGRIRASRAPIRAAAACPVASTSAWSSGWSDRPAAMLVTRERPRTSAPRWRAAMASSAVDMPTRSAPAAASIRISAGVS